MVAALEWYRAVGVDLAVGEEPVDRFAASQMARPRPAPPPAATQAAAPLPPPATAAGLNADPSEARKAYFAALEAADAADYGPLLAFARS